MALKDLFKGTQNVIGGLDEDSVEMYDEGGYDEYPEDEEPQTALTGSSSASIEMKVVKPTTYKLDEVKKFGDLLLGRKTVLLNLESTPLEDARRILDFLTGVVHAVDGKIEKVGKKTFVATPHNVDVTGSSEVSEEEAYEQ